MCKCTLRTPLQCNFIYLGNQEIYCICKTNCIIYVLFSTKCHLFHSFYVQIIFMFFTNTALKPQYQDSHVKVNDKRWAYQKFPGEEFASKNIQI